MSRASLSVIVLNYRTPALTLACMASLAGEVDPERGERVIVVDNDSQDGSAERIAEGIEAHGWADRMELVCSPKNGGFSFGNNVGVRAREADAYLLLNSDTVVRPGAIAELQRALKLHPRVGLVGPRLESPDGEPQASCFRDLTLIGEFEGAARTGVLRKLLRRWVVSDPQSGPAQPEWLSFACVLIRAETFRDAGLLDEAFFMYYEDADMCRRARAVGWETLFWPSACVAHIGEASDPGRPDGRRPPYFYASRQRYYRKHLGPAGLVGANLAWTYGRGLSWLRERAGRPQGVPPLDLRKIWLG